MSIDIRTLKRRMLIDLAQRRQRAGTGSAPAFLVQRTTQMAWPDLSSVLSPIPWAVVGAVATRLYMPERTTQDMDIVIRGEDTAAVRQKLSNAGFVYQGELNIDGSTWLTPDGQIIDIIERHGVWWTDALIEAQTNRDAQGLPILPLRYLVLMKFQSGHVQDLADITRMLGQANATTLDAVRALFQQYTPADLSDLESLISLGKLEMGDESYR
jgi:hypothetical protein